MTQLIILEYIDYKTIVTAIISISLFLIGLFINWTIKKLERRNTVQLIKEVVEIWIDQMKESLSIQARECHNCSNFLQLAENIVPPKMRHIALPSDKFNDIKLDVLLNVFVRNMKGNKKENAKDLFDIIKGIEFFKKLIDEIILDHNKCVSELMLYNDQWNACVKHLNEVEIEMLHIINNQESHTAFNFLKSFHIIVNQWKINFQTSTDEKTKTQLIDPILALINEQLQIDPTNQFVIAISQIIFDFNTTYRRWKLLNEDGYNLFRRHTDSIISSYKRLSRINSKNKNKQLLWLYHLK